MALLDGLRAVFDADDDPTPDPVSVTPDVLLEALRTRRRRLVLQTVADLETVDVGELAEIVASEENDVPVAQLTSQQRKRVYVSLYQTHLPKLHDMGLVDGDGRDQDITATDATEAALAVLATATEVTTDDQEDPDDAGPEILTDGGQVVDVDLDASGQSALERLDEAAKQIRIVRQEVAATEGEHTELTHIESRIRGAAAMLEAWQDDQTDGGER